MKEILFASDLDNTLLFSYKHVQPGDQCVELLDGREQGFCSRRSLKLLARILEATLFIPITTRSVEQYRRIGWPAACSPHWAVTTNGGLLLEAGVPDKLWQAETEALAAPWRSELQELQGLVTAYPLPKRCRMVDDIYLFAACDDRAAAEELGAFFAGQTSLETAVSGRKVYFFPPPINKGTALERLRARFGAESKIVEAICAGDSVIDIPLLRLADLAIMPEELAEGLPLADCRGRLLCWQGKGRFAEFVLEAVLMEAGAV